MGESMRLQDVVSVQCESADSLARKLGGLRTAFAGCGLRFAGTRLDLFVRCSGWLAGSDDHLA